MKHIFITLVLGIFATLVYGQSAVKLNPNTEEQPFQCGAAFSMLSQVYRLAGNAESSATYQAKFDRLSAQIENTFAKSNRNKADAEAYMQKHADLLAGIAERDADLVLAFARVCDKRYPE